ncbi:hypothetical protein Q8G41_27455, partial [Klebsiella pneumoniae]|uniref:hypothetical protein n=1 Tax=Klebsiella pneumoniae TaxID=573 RepID=UPI003013CDCF
QKGSNFQIEQNGPINAPVQNSIGSSNTQIINYYNVKVTDAQARELADKVTRSAKMPKSPESATGPEPAPAIDYQRAVREWAEKYGLTPDLA